MSHDVSIQPACVDDVAVRREGCRESQSGERKGVSVADILHSIHLLWLARLLVNGSKH